MKNGPEKKSNHRQTNNRSANFELLRLIAMLMVVSLHYLSKGQVLPEFTEKVTGNEYLACLLESFSIVAVNAFVLLSGYFLVNSEFKCRRVVQLIGQALFYTLLVPAVLIAVGILPLSNMDIYALLNNILPVQMEHYWFITAYVLLYLFTPILNIAVRQMKQKQLGMLIMMLLLVFSIPKSIIPFTITIDRMGYDFVWFICVYLVAAYIRLYGIRFYGSGRKSVIAYCISALLIFIYTLGAGFIYQSTGKLQNQIMEAAQYNHILNLIAAISFFYIFYYMIIKKESRAAAVICRISPYALGVYLLHEQLNVRYLWPEWLQVERYSSTPWFLLHYAGTIVSIFVIGIIVDWIRSLLIRGIGKIIKPVKIGSKLQELDNIINGK